MAEPALGVMPMVAMATPAGPVMLAVSAGPAVPAVPPGSAVPVAPPWQTAMRLVECLQTITRAVQRGALAEELALSGAAASDPDAVLRAVHTRLADVALNLLQDATEAPTQDERRRRKQALYAAVAVVDEALSLDLDWPGRACWPDHLLEQRLFQSRLAARRFYERAELALKADARVVHEREVAAIFLLALQLGFKGRHRCAEGVNHVAVMRQRLHAFATAGVPPKPPGRLMAQPYAHNLSLPRDERIAPLARWRGWVLAGVLLWLVGSTLWWSWLVQPLQRLSG